ncbi:MAG: putative Dephospho-CoA kinaselike protein [Candidatus Saccharibacteria bacterium]|nr:putative Dephospho-CoA kinaselike protein [Candidatus Saccharibacteria bacterium]MDB5180353.1 putative Dephospho-CoA kinaselike protein [Candidatus Saccharibacteria bacterium]
MTHHENLKIIAFVGLAGSGKSTAVEYFSEKGYPKVYFGGVILNAMEEAGIERTADHEQKFREEIREKNGNDFVANKIVEQIEHLANSGQHRIIADGLYTWTEFQVLKKAFPGELDVVAIVAPRHLRYHRLSERTIRPFTATEAHERDITEIEHLEKGGPIAIADHYVVNDGSTEELHEKLAKLSEELDF